MVLMILFARIEIGEVFMDGTGNNYGTGNNNYGNYSQSQRYPPPNQGNPPPNRNYDLPQQPSQQQGGPERTAYGKFWGMQPAQVPVSPPSPQMASTVESYTKEFKEANGKILGEAITRMEGKNSRQKSEILEKSTDDQIALIGRSITKSGSLPQSERATYLKAVKEYSKSLSNGTLNASQMQEFNFLMSFIDKQLGSVTSPTHQAPAASSAQRPVASSLPKVSSAESLLNQMGKDLNGKSTSIQIPIIKQVLVQSKSLEPNQQAYLFKVLDRTCKNMLTGASKEEEKGIKSIQQNINQGLTATKQPPQEPVPQAQRPTQRPAMAPQQPASSAQRPVSPTKQSVSATKQSVSPPQPQPPVRPTPQATMARSNNNYGDVSRTRTQLLTMDCFVPKESSNYDDFIKTFDSSMKGQLGGERIDEKYKMMSETERAKCLDLVEIALIRSVRISDTGERQKALAYLQDQCLLLSTNAPKSLESDAGNLYQVIRRRQAEIRLGK